MCQWCRSALRTGADSMGFGGGGGRELKLKGAYFFLHAKVKEDNLMDHSPPCKNGDMHPHTPGSVDLYKMLARAIP